MTDSEIIEQFSKMASSASFHYADDSGNEWGQARQAEDAAMQIYHDNPKLQPKMDKIGATQLWAMDFKKRAKGGK